MKKYAEYKDSGAKWIGRIPSEWKTIRFKFLNNGLNTGEGIDKEYWTDDQSKCVYYTAGLEPIYTIYKEFPEWKYTNKNDLLLARNGTPYVYYPPEGACYSDHIIRAEIKENNDKRFVRYCLQQSIMSMVIDTVSIATWSASLWNEQIIPWPSIEEQHRIADYLDKKIDHIDNLIDEAKASIEEYKAWKASIIYEAVTKGLDKDAEMKDSGYSFIGYIPAHWKTTYLKRICDRISDGSHFSPETTLKGMPYVTAGDIHGEGIDYNNCKTISQKDFQSLVDAGCQPHKGDVLLVKDGATTGRVGYMIDDGPCVLLSSVAMLTPSETVSGAYLMRFIESEALQFQIRKTMAGSAMPRTTLTKLSSYIAIDCPYEEQVEIVSYLDNKCVAIDTLVAEKEALISDLEAYKKSLIFEVVTGKRKVV